MDAILEQLELNQTFFHQLAIFFVLFVVLSQVYFKPFLKLIQTRHRRTVEDREEAGRMMVEAKSKLEEYKKRITEERGVVRKEFEAVLNEAKKSESQILAQAREEAKKITQDASDSVNSQREQLKRQLELDVESIARSISETLVSRKV